MRAGAGESVEYLEQIVEAEACDPLGDTDLADYIELSERCADDPDAEQPARYHALLKKYAMQGALVGFQHGGPVLISVDREFLIAASGGKA